MNERIRKLANHAGFIGERLSPVVGTTQETALVNFAELIVNELHAVNCRTLGRPAAESLYKITIKELALDEQKDK